MRPTTTASYASRPPAPDTADATHTDALDPVRTSVLAAVGTETDELLARTEADAQDRIEQARTHHDELVDAAREEGRRLADDDLARRLARARRDARRRVLQVQRDAVQALHHTAVDRLHDATGTDAYERLLGHLRDAAERQLGPGTLIEEHPDGGLVATNGDRRVDYSLPALVARAVADLGEEVTRPWS